MKNEKLDCHQFFFHFFWTFITFVYNHFLFSDKSWCNHVMSVNFVVNEKCVCVGGWVNGYVNKIDIEECNQEFYWKWSNIYMNKHPIFSGFFHPLSSSPFGPNQMYIVLNYFIHQSLTQTKRKQTNKNILFIFFVKIIWFF